MQVKLPNQIERDIEYVSILPPWVKWIIIGLVVTIIAAYLIGGCNTKRQIEFRNSRAPLQDSIASVRQQWDQDKERIDTAFARVQRQLEYLEAAQLNTSKVSNQSQQTRNNNAKASDKVREDIYNPNTSIEQLKRINSSIFD